MGSAAKEKSVSQSNNLHQAAKSLPNRTLGRPTAPCPLAKFQIIDSAQLAKLSKADRMAYRSKLISAGRAKLKSIPDGSTKQNLTEACSRLERNNQAMEMARLSDSVYQDEGAPEGWTRISDSDSLKDLPPDLQDPKLWNDPKTNFHAALYRSDNGQIVLAFRGTDMKSRKDWTANVMQGWGSDTPQYTEGITLAQKIVSNFPGMEITGHSKGGGIGSAAAAVTGAPATVFNPAGVNANTVAPYKVTLDKAAENSTYYDVKGQILDDINGKTVFGHTVPIPIGTRIQLPAVDESGTPMKFPSPPEPPKNQWSIAQDWAYDKAAAGYLSKVFQQQVDRHMMNTVENGIEEEKREDIESIEQSLR